MSHHPSTRIISQHTTQTSAGFRCAVSDEHHPGMLGEAHADTTTVVLPGQVARVERYGSLVVTEAEEGQR